jgi:hypothetical protein
LVRFEKTTVLKNLSIIIYFLEILPLIFCISFLKKRNTKELKVFSYYIFCLASFALLAITFKFIIENRKILFINLNVYLLVEFLVLSIFFKEIFKSRVVKKLCIIIIPLFIIFSCFCFFYNKTYYAFIAEAIIFIIYLLFYFFEKINVVTHYPLYKSISFWLCVGLFIYFTGNFFFLLLVNSSKDVNFITQMRIVNFIVVLLKDIILALAWFAYERTETNTDIIKFPNGLGLDDDLPFTKPNHA